MIYELRGREGKIEDQIAGTCDICCLDHCAEKGTMVSVPAVKKGRDGRDELTANKQDLWLNQIQCVTTSGAKQNSCIRMICMTL